MSRANIFLSKQDMVFRSLPRSFDGYRVAFISDLHFYGKVGAVELAVAEAINQMNPDLLLLGGDVVNQKRHWPASVSYLKGLQAKGRKLCVLGNWEYRRTGGPSEYSRWMGDAGFEVLCNTSVTISEGEESITIVGLDDPRYGKPSAAAFVDTEGFTIALCHNPDVLLQLDRKPFSLLLCGHTHGGQIRLPLLGPIFTPTKLGKKFLAGLHELEESQYVYITMGIGAGIPHTRIGCPAEVVMITLHSQKESK